jgi:hypothetical protein
MRGRMLLMSKSVPPLPGVTQVVEEGIDEVMLGRFEKGYRKRPGNRAIPY